MAEDAVRPLEIRTQRLVLTPLKVEDAAEMVTVLGDESLYEYTGGTPPDEGMLREPYEVQTVGPSDAGEQWFNWIVRLAVDGQPIGFVQATLTGRKADVAWLIDSGWQRRGYASRGEPGDAWLAVRCDRC